MQAIQRGILQVVPQAVLEMLTWHEFEKRVCGDPEISMEALRNYSKYLQSTICTCDSCIKVRTRKKHFCIVSQENNKMQHLNIQKMNQEETNVM